VLLNPFAPHITSELWEKIDQRFGNVSGEITAQSWPAYDETLLVEDEVEIVVQINGKVRARMQMPIKAGNDEMKAAALALPKIAESLAGREIRRVVVVRNKLVNIVIN
jgi:leucyl-tRNA synthetase